MPDRPAATRGPGGPASGTLPAQCDEPTRPERRGWRHPATPRRKCVHSLHDLPATGFGPVDPYGRHRTPRSRGRPQAAPRRIRARLLRAFPVVRGPHRELHGGRRAAPRAVAAGPGSVPGELPRRRRLARRAGPAGAAAPGRGWTPGGGIRAGPGLGACGVVERERRLVRRSPAAAPHRRRPAAAGRGRGPVPGGDRALDPDREPDQLPAVHERDGRARLPERGRRPHRVRLSCST